MARRGAKGAPLRGAEGPVPGLPEGSAYSDGGSKTVIGQSRHYSRHQCAIPTGWKTPLDDLESHFSALESRVSGLETGMDGIARSNHGIETMLADSLTRLSAT